ncbi:MAG: prepilin-type N-terminal cleavage/methylation domain-containing protein [Candidatus Avelusimicrobium sp.]|uniref:pilin n=1 Tax=Candidatus Avelusimicrobium sp. TaxID=3048833 RepID=UPI003F117B0E
MHKKYGFTLIELLVVVLIIGILSAVALPQYEKAVEKSRATEAIQNISLFKKQIDLYILSNGYPSTGRVFYPDFADVTLPFPLNDDGSMRSKNFWYWSFIDPNRVYVELSRESEGRGLLYDLFCQKTPHLYNDDSPMADGWYCACVTELTDFGRKMCKTIFEPLGYKYSDAEL